MKFTDIINKISRERNPEKGEGKKITLYISGSRLKALQEIKDASGKMGIGNFMCDFWEEVKKYFKEK